MPTWLKYASVALLGYLFGNGTLTPQGVADAITAIMNAFQH